MAVTTIRPTSIYQDGWANGVGAGTHQVRISDNTDTTSIRSNGVDTKFIALFSGYSTAGGSYIRRFRYNVRYVTTTGTSGDGRLNVLVNQYTPVGGGIYAASFPQLTSSTYLASGSATVTTATSGWIVLDQANTAFEDADINLMGVYVRFEKSGASNPTDVMDVFDVWIEVETNISPTTSGLTVPTTTTTRPPLTATYNDASDLDAMIAYQGKVFDLATYTAGGFDPFTSGAAIYDTGIQFNSISPGGSFTTVTPTVDLVNGSTYRWYVWAGQALDSGVTPLNVPGKNASVANFSTFTLALDAPAQPLLTAVADDANGRITLTVNARDNILSKNDASFETSVAGYTATNAALAQDGTQFLNATKSMKMTASSAANMSAITATGLSGAPVAASTQYTALASFKTAVTGRSCHVDISWYTSAGAFISTSTGGNVTDTTGGWTQASNTVTSPSNAAFAAVVVAVNAPALSEVHFVDQVALKTGASTTWTRGGFVDANQTIYIQKSTNGTTWSLVRGGTIIDPAVNQVAVVQDYEEVPGTSTSFRAYVSGIDAGVAIAGPYSATANATSSPTNTTGWWLKDPLDPTVNMQIDVNAPTWDEEIDEEQAVYKPLGRQYPVVVSDIVHGDDGTLNIELVGLTAKATFIALRAKQHVLLLQRVYPAAIGDQKYIRLGAKLNLSERNTNPILVNAVVSYVEVQAP